jgi:hypothetical protein
MVINPHFLIIQNNPKFNRLNNCDFESIDRNMSGQLAIRYHKWDKSDYQGLSQSILQHLGMKSLQFYMPIFSLYFYIHNTPNSQKTVDFERKYYIHRLLEITKQRYYNSNILGRALIYDSGKNTSEIKDVFCKTIPILDPMHCLHNNYNLRGHHNHHLPSGYNYNTFHKINNLDNGAYIDVFCSYIFGQLTHLKKNPSFPMFYGAVNGLGEYKYDITEDITISDKQSFMKSRKRFRWICMCQMMK